MEKAEELQTFKVVIIGDNYTGKTSLAYRLCTGKFYEKLETTIGVDFFEKILLINNNRIRLQLWDTAGQERFRRSMTTHYYRNVDAIVFVYDISSEGSFESLNQWIEEYKHFTIPDKIEKILIGTKNDLTNSKRIQSITAKKFADKHEMEFYETSSKNDEDLKKIDNIFKTLAERLLKERPDVLENKGSLKLSKLQSISTKVIDAKEGNDKIDKEKIGRGKKKCCGN